MSGTRLSRRGFLRTTAGATAAAAATGSAAGQEGERPEFGDWLDGVDGGYEDARGQDEVTVAVGAEGNSGNYAFSPAGLRVDPGTTVVWEWTGEGQQHNVVAVEGASFDSGEFVGEAGHTFEHTFEESGLVTYQCDPHVGLGMKGAVAVGDDVPTASGGGDGGGDGGDGDDGGGNDGDGGSAPPRRSGGLPDQFATVSGVALGAMGLATLATLYLVLLGVREDRPDARQPDEE